MEYRILGKTGLRVSRVGFGGIPIQRIDAAGTKALVERLLEAGVNYIDTARGYTVSESYLGEALEGVRDRFVLATKSMARTKAAMAQDIETSLSNLRTGYIDLYQVHNPNMAQLEQVVGEGGALEALLDELEAFTLTGIPCRTPALQSVCAQVEAAILAPSAAACAQHCRQTLTTLAPELARLCREADDDARARIASQCVDYAFSETERAEALGDGCDSSLRLAAASACAARRRTRRAAAHPPTERTPSWTRATARAAAAGIIPSATAT